MRVIGIAILTAWVLALTASAALYGESRTWFSPNEHRAAAPDEHLQERVAEAVAETDEPFSWVPFAGGAVILGGGIAAILLIRQRNKKERVWRTEDEAWADLLGPDAI